MQVEDKLVNLASGIAVTVEVRTGSRRSIEYLMSPLRRYKQESMGRVGGDRGDQEQPLGPESHSNCIADLFRPSRVVRQGISPLAQILDNALLESLKGCSRFRVGTKPSQAVQESLNELRVHQRIEKCLRIDLEYGDRERTIPIDILVFVRGFFIGLMSDCSSIRSCLTAWAAMRSILR